MSSLSKYTKKEVEKLLSENILKEIDTGYIFLENYKTKSPSTAANIISGRSSNGRSDWRTSTGIKLGEYMPK